ncbi:alpha-N-acetylgalactosaminide alpha-2,6-sialyltransferase 5 isoform X2 [Mobula birostris]|uniref:alpha-N-acetylgalactosaminide alpha-2,6-sialyltransferase 5 isoform X2 n=1 Tax=Mobula birostris TaxID=1983395 RepID=UPI003B28660A
MKKLRHLLAVFLGLSTCGTLLVLYATRGERGADSNPPSSAERRNSVTRGLPEPLPALTGYINFIDRKVFFKASHMRLLNKIRAHKDITMDRRLAESGNNGVLSWLATGDQWCPAWALQVHCKSCALVTSSGHLIGSKRGAEIDQVECVIRMNDAPTLGYQEDVGRRTSLRVVAHSSIQRLLQKGSQLLNASREPAFIFWGPSSCLRRDGKGRLYNQLQLIHRIAPRLKLHTISRQKMLHFDQLFERETGKDRKTSNSWLSTGWFTMIIALELCDRIDVYGMVPPNLCRDPTHRQVPYHYYEPSGIDECTMYMSHELGRKGSHHRFITEKRVFARWAKKYSIHFHQPEWGPGSESAAANLTGAGGSQ